MSTAIGHRRERLEWADAARGIAIILVVVGHVTPGLQTSGIAGSWGPPLGAVNGYIYAFHMGVFLLLAGAFAAPKAGRVGEFVADKVRTLAYPYVVWGFLQTAAQASLAGVTNTTVGWADLPRLAYDPPMQFWFLYVLFLGFVGYAAVRRCGGGAGAFLAAAVVVSCGIEWAGARGDSLAGRVRDNVPLLALGVRFAPRLGRVGAASTGTLLLLAVAGYGLTAAVVSAPAAFPWAMFTPVPGAIATFAAAALLVRGGVGGPLSYLGRLSLEVYLAHVLAYAGMRVVLVKVFGVYSAPAHLVLGTAAGVLGPVLLAEAARRAGFRRLFRWPARTDRPRGRRVSRVLHLYAGNLYGGVESYLVTLAKFRHLAPQADPHFGLCFGGRLRDELTAAGATVHDLGAVRFSRPWTVFRARRRLKTVLGETAFDAVVTHSCWPHAVFAPVVRRAGVRLVNAVHDVLGGRHWLDRWAARTPPDLVIANSHFTAGPAAKVFRQSPVEVCYLPVAARPSGERESVRAALGTPPGAVVILQASRLERWKGQAVHLEALAMLKGVPGWEAWFAGGPQKAGETAFETELKAFARQAGIADRVQFLGQRSDVPALMASADIYCQPNTGPEPFGVAFVEALNAGLPVVASAAGGPAEIVTPACGVLCPPGNAEAVAGALKLLIGDSEVRAKLSVAAPARAAELCDPARQVTRLAELTTGTDEHARNG